MAKMAVHIWGYGTNSLMKALVGKMIFQKMHLLAPQSVGVDMKRELKDSER